MKKIGFDFDGVIQNSNMVFKVLMYNTFGTMDFKSYDGAGNERFKYEIEGVSTTKIWNVIHKSMREYQPLMEPIAGAPDLLRTVYAQSLQPIEIITARPDDVREATEEWLKTHIKVPCNVHIVPPPKNGDGVKNAKVDIIWNLELDAFVEDRFKYASKIAQGCENIQHMFLLNKPYNMGRRVAGKVHRIDSLYELIPYFQISLSGCNKCPMSQP